MKSKVTKYKLSLPLCDADAQINSIVHILDVNFDKVNCKAERLTVRRLYHRPFFEHALSEAEKTDHSSVYYSNDDHFLPEFEHLEWIRLSRNHLSFLINNRVGVKPQPSKYSVEKRSIG